MSIDKIQLRNAFGQFATGITVITANPDGFEPFGMTVNSFSSLSLDPPLLLWSLQNDSDCCEAFAAASHFAVNILNDEQQALSGRYAKKGEHALEQGDYKVGESGCAVLNESLAYFECRSAERYEGGDHTILVGEVECFEVSDEQSPLLFFAGKYHTLAK